MAPMAFDTQQFFRYILNEYDDDVYRSNILLSVAQIPCKAFLQSLFIMYRNDPKTVPKRSILLYRAVHRLNRHVARVPKLDCTEVVHQLSQSGHVPIWSYPIICTEMVCTKAVIYRNGGITKHCIGP